MAPARMVQFIKQHVAGCSVCQEDPDLQEEILKITEIVLPESKIPKAIRLKQEQDDLEYADEADDDSSDETDDSEEFEDVEETEEEDTFVDDDESDEEPLAPEDEEL